MFFPVFTLLPVTSKKKKSTLSKTLISYLYSNLLQIKAIFGWRKIKSWSFPLVATYIFSLYIEVVKSFRQILSHFYAFSGLFFSSFLSIHEHWQVERLYLSSAVLTDSCLWVLFCPFCDGNHYRLSLALCHHLWNAGKEKYFTVFVSVLIADVPVTFHTAVPLQSAISCIHVFLYVGR